MSEKLELKSIGEILEYNFFIPSYQRGYRWGEQQVTDLLNDIWEFAQNRDKEEFYPLQPIVVFNEDNRYEIIDGQQRITTIYIIFKYLENLRQQFRDKQEQIKELNDIFGFCLGNIENLKITLPTIVYDTREKSEIFLTNDISKAVDTSNPDFYYMSSAYQTIKIWFQKNSIHLDIFIETLRKNTKVIWYEIEVTTEKEKIDIFSRLNIGKIPLTNAELIKALLLQDESDYKKQIELGNELDRIEYTLRDNKFWYFLTDKDKDTKIDLVFELLADKYKEDDSKDEYLKKIDKEYETKYSFYIFEYLLKHNKKTKEEVFKNLKEYFRFLEEWYLDKEFYHKVGYLVVRKIGLSKLIEEYKKIDKSDFRKYLDEKIEEQLNRVNITDLRYGNSNIKNVLLLFNIETILQNKNISYKFDFHKYKTESWDIEHIRSQTNNEIEGEIKGKDRNKWIEAIFNIYGKSTNKINEAKIKYKDNFRFTKFYNKLAIVFGENKTFDEELKDSIGNLALLDSSTNRGYGNAFFPIKRAIIMQEDIDGTFIPPCTKNVFLKVYSNSIKNMMSWDENDIKSYQKEIFTLLEKYGVLK